MEDEINVATVWRWAVFGVVGVIAAVAFIIWLVTASSGVRGHAGVIRRNNDSNNQIAAQAEFERVWGDIQRDAGVIRLETDPDRRQTAQEVCLADVATYNLDAQSTTLKDWRPDNLPESVDADAECGTK